MRLLLTQVAQRLSGKGGEPVIQLQTAFGGGKTHTLLAVYHLATRKCSIQDLLGIPDLLDKAGLMDVPHARVVVIDGTDLAPGQARKYGKHTVKHVMGRTRVATRRRRSVRAREGGRCERHVTGKGHLEEASRSSTLLASC